MDRTRGALWTGLKPAPWMFGWVLGAIVLIATFGADAVTQTFREPDSAMRLVEVRDFLSGQDWFDTTQYRLAPPDGVVMHWARWIDAGIAAPIAVLSPLLGREGAEIAVAFIWPLCWLAAFVFLMTRIASELSGDREIRSRVEWAAAVVAALAFPALDRFGPGAFDHHNVILVLIAGALLALLKMGERPLLGVVAGSLIGLAVATAAEALPFLAIAAIGAGMVWVFRPAEYGRGLFWFGVGVGCASLLSFLALVHPAQWSVPRCDSMSTSFLSIGLATSAVAMALGRALPAGMAPTIMLRLGCAAVAGALAGAALVKLAPECLGGAYGNLEPEMKTLWMAQISEARPLHQLLSDNLAMFFSMSGAAASGLVFAALMLVRRRTSPQVWIAGWFLLGAVVMMAWQIRGATFATALAVPFAAVAVVRAQAAYRGAPTPRAMLSFAGVAIIATAAAWAVIGQQVQRLVTPPVTLSDFAIREADARACFDGDELSGLDDEPAGLVLNQFAVGSSVLASTRHSVLAAPYHRNSQGTLTAINAFRSTPEAAKEIVEASGATLVLVCRGLPEAQFYMEHPAGDGVRGEDTLAYALREGRAPVWLERVNTGDSPLQLYRVRDLGSSGLRGRL